MKIEIDAETLPLPTQHALYIWLKEKFEKKPASQEAILKTNLEEMASFNPKIRRMLRAFQISTIEELTGYSAQELRKIRGMGRWSVGYVEAFLFQYQLTLKKY